jgi:uncharacterized protein (TIGR03086 family)
MVNGMNVMGLHRNAVENFTQKVQQVSDDQWSQPTPCTEWDVRTLVNHVVSEERWVKPLVDGKTIDEVGSALDGDLLGDDPAGAAAAAGAEAATAFDEGEPENGLVHLSFGDTPVDEYAMQMLADHLVHGWDLAAATGMDRTMDPELVSVVQAWFAPQEEAWRAAGAIGPRVEVDADDPQSELLAVYGRHADWTA